jgi:hypothetical protein
LSVDAVNVARCSRLAGRVASLGHLGNSPHCACRRRRPQQHKSLGDIGAFDDLDGPGSEVFQRPLQLVSGVGAVSEDVTQPGERTVHTRKQRRRAVTILHVSWRNDGTDQQADRVGAGIFAIGLRVDTRLGCTRQAGNKKIGLPVVACNQESL